MTGRAFDLAAARPWCILPESLNEVLAIADRMGDPEALETRLGKPLENTRTVDTRSNGIAVVPVTGPIFRYANLLTMISGATSTQVLATDIQTAIDDRSVRGIILDINSPGGEAAGINELAQMIFDARSKKPIWAYVGGTGASGAYWIASAASKILVDKTAILGSIGVVMSYRDTRSRDEKSGVRDVEIVSSNSPDKRLDPTTEIGRAKVLKIVDDMADVFIGSVARNRGVTRDQVISDFGRGGLLVGENAVKAGMADGASSLESAISELAGSASTSHWRHAMKTGAKEPVAVSSTAELRSAIKDSEATVQAGSAVMTAALKEERDAGHAAGLEVGEAKVKPAVDAAVTAERKRVGDITAATQKGFEKEAKAAIDSGKSAGDFALEQSKLANERGVTLGSIKSDSSPPATHGGQPAAGESKGKGGWLAAAKKFGAK